MSEQHTPEIEITERMYVAYGTDTGILFGIPADLRGSVETIVKIAIRDLRAHIKELEGELLTLITFSADLQQRLEAENKELVEALKAFVDAFGKCKPQRMYTRNGTYSFPDVVTISTKIAEQAHAALAKARPDES